jgi:hypothetical protein
MGDDTDKRLAAKRSAYNTLDAIKAAGLGPVKRKARTGLYVVLGLLLMASVGAGVYFGLVYWADTEVPQAGPKKATGYKQLEDQNLSADDAARIKGMFEVDRAPAQPGAAPRRKTVFDRQLLAFYQDQKGAKHDYVPAEPKYTDGLLIQTGTVSGPGAVDKQEAVPTGPKRIGGPQRLSNAQISAVVSKHRKRIKRRLERDLNRYPELAGKLILIVRVRPDGTVERAQVETPKYHGTGIEEFLLKDVARWKFPRFDGVPYDLTFPFILSGK